jgi:Tol biopolymer transport system component
MNGLCWAVACLWFFSCSLAATSEVVSTTTTTGSDSAVLGSENSGYVSPWAIAPVDDAGTVVFLSEAPEFSVLETNSGGIDWDLFSRTLAGDVTTVSVAETMLDDTDPTGQATALAFAGDDVLEVREEGVDPSNMDNEQLLWRSLSSPGTFTRLAEGSETFDHVRLGDDGGLAVFAASDNSDVDGDSDELDDIYLQRLTPTILTRVSVRATDGDGNGTTGTCAWPDVDASGSNVVFQSKDSRFVDDDTNVEVDVFLWQNGTLSRVNSRYTDTGEGFGSQTLYPCKQPVISGDASKVAYVSADPAIVAGDEMAYQDVFVYDVALGETVCVSRRTDGELAQGDCEQPDIDRSGRFVVFASNASNFPGHYDSNGDDDSAQIYLYDLISGTLECLSLADDGTGASSDCYSPTISPSGRYVTFSTAAPNLVGESDAALQVICVDRGEYYANVPPVAENVQASCRVDVDGSSDGVEFALSGSDADGDALTYRLVSWPEEGTLTDADGASAPAVDETFAADRLPLTYVPDDSASESQVVTFSYVVNDGKADSEEAEVRIAVVGYLGYLQIASLGNEGQQGDDEAAPCNSGEGVSMSDDGQWVAFTSEATDLSADSPDENTGITSWNAFYVRNTVSEQTYALDFIGATASGYAVPQVAADGSAVVYSDGEALYWLALGDDGPELVMSREVADVEQFSLSSDAGMVLFRCKDESELQQIYLWTPFDDNKVSRVSEDENGSAASESCSNPVISADGKRVAFRSKGDFSGSAASDYYAVWLKDLTSGTVEQVADTEGSMLAPDLSQTGRYLSYYRTVNDASTSVILDLYAEEGSRTVATIKGAKALAISADGRYAFLTSAKTDFTLDEAYDGLDLPEQPADVAQAWRYDLASNTVAPLSLTLTQAGYANSDVGVGAISASGRYALFATADSLTSDDTNNASDVFLMDLGEVENEPPVIADSAAEVDEDASVTVSLSATDAEANDLIFEIVSSPANGSLGDISTPTLGGGNPTVVYTPNTDWNGEDSFTYRCRDAEGYSNTGMVAITVNPVNDAPVWTSSDELVAEAYVGEENRLDLSQFVNDVDDGDTLTFTLVSGPDGAYVADDGHTLVLGSSTAAGDVTIVLTVSDGSEEVATELTVTVRYMRTLDLTPGWNLISFPYEPAAETCLDLLDAATGPVWFWQDGTYNAVTEDAESADYLSELTSGRGYWFFYLAEEAGELIVLEDPLAEAPGEQFGLTTDWQLLGPVGYGESVELTDSDGKHLSAGDAWEWDGERYLLPEDNILQAGRGYWLRYPQSVTVDLGLE